MPSRQPAIVTTADFMERSTRLSAATLRAKYDAPQIENASPLIVSRMDDDRIDARDLAIEQTGKRQLQTTWSGGAHEFAKDVIDVCVVDPHRNRDRHRRRTLDERIHVDLRIPAPVGDWIIEVNARIFI